MAQTTEAEQITPTSSPSRRQNWVWGFLLVGILVLGAYFRMVGMNWDESQHLHPDERFLTMVTSAMTPVKSLGAYFNTDTSTLNPQNLSYNFFVYGTLPLFIVRYVAEAIKQVGYDEIFMVGRYASAIFDLMTVLLVFLIAQRLYGKTRLSLLAAAFAAFSVLPIQLSHFFTVDNATTFFTFLAVFFAVDLLMTRESSAPEGKTGQLLWRDWRNIGSYLLFGLALGMAAASKVNAGLICLLLPAAALIRFLRLPAPEQNRQWAVILRNLAFAAIVAVIIFRIFQPYAFSGPGFFGMIPNPKWMDNLRELAAQSGGDVDFPPALQWADRPLTFAWTNMVDWGLGLPLGLLAWAGFLWMGWRILRGEWRLHGMLWGWTALYFTWQSINWVRAMRYQNLVYPSLAIIAAWAVFALWDSRSASPKTWLKISGNTWRKIISAWVGSVVLVGSIAWAFAFTRIYDRPMTRVDASRWIYQNVPGPINVKIITADGVVSKPIAYPYDFVLSSKQPYSAIFTSLQDGAMSELTLPSLTLLTNQGVNLPVRVKAEISDVENSNTVLALGGFEIQAFNTPAKYSLTLNKLVEFKQNHRYALVVRLDPPGLGEITFGEPVSLSIYQNFAKFSLPVKDLQVIPGQGQALRFSAPVTGTLRSVVLPLRIDDLALRGDLNVAVAISNQTDSSRVGGIGSASVKVASGANTLLISFEKPVEFIAKNEYVFTMDLAAALSPTFLVGDVEFRMLDQVQELYLPPPVHLVKPDETYFATITPDADGFITEVSLGRVAQVDPFAPAEDGIVINIVDPANMDIPLAKLEWKGDLRPKNNPGGEPLRFNVNPPLQVQKGKAYSLVFQATNGALAIRGSAPAHETGWDDPLPLRMDGMDAYGGMLRPDLKFEIYWDDNADKLSRFIATLDQADYIFMSSNRQWGTTIRVPERYPLTTEFYRQLLGCPLGKELFWCYATAEAGQFNSALGFDLVKVFQSEPNLGPISFNSQFAEEAFSVYDHPKVMIFQKRADYDPQQTRNLLSAVDLSYVIHTMPAKASGAPDNLMLPPDQLAQQQAGGTWSELFSRDSLLNQYPGLGLIVWYLVVFALGWTMTPMVRLALGSLPDKGYPLARLAGILLSAWLVWMAGSNNIAVTPGAISGVMGVILLVNLGLFWLQRKEMRAEWRERRRYYLIMEALFLAFFVLFLLIRLGNPDLWHAWKGGEKPMDFSYFNAVLKSTTFPPFDPWLAGGYINYYYYGFVLAGVLVKWLGIVPSVAYNLILPTFFAMVGMGAFSVGWNLIASVKKPEPEDEPAPRMWGLPQWPLLGGLASSIGLLILGNWGSVRQIWDGFQRLGAPDGLIDKLNIFSRISYGIEGIGKYLGGTPLPYPPGDWYWIPSRAIPGEAITEFPFFTFLFADPHAHLFALGVTILALAFALAILLRKWQWLPGGRGWLEFGAAMGLGALTIGALRPSNMWDFPTFLGLAMVALLYTAIRHARLPQGVLRFVPEKLQGSLLGLLAAIALAVLSIVAYQPFSQWFGQGYTEFDAWQGATTPFWSFTTHWGVFLVFIGVWLLKESIDWMTATPLRSVNKLRPYKGLLLTIGVIWAVLCIGPLLRPRFPPLTDALLPSKNVIDWLVIIIRQWVMRNEVSGLILTMMAWVLALLLRPGQPIAKRAVLFLTGTGLALALAAEFFVLRGDLGRMNFVFKLYMQIWTLFSISAAMGFVWVLTSIESWHPRWRNAFMAVSAVLIFGAALYPFLASYDKIRDRMSSVAPHTLDGMEYMNTASYFDQATEYRLDEDYRAIRWMQDNVKGSPVIVEGNIPEYRWGTRFTVYTGLPGVVGWNWHQRQQRALTPSTWVTDRVDAVVNFYKTTDANQVRAFLLRYNAKYIIVGKLERANFPGAGLEKFDQWQGQMWQEVYRDGDTAIYHVND